MFTLCIGLNLDANGYSPTDSSDKIALAHESHIKTRFSGTRSKGVLTVSDLSEFLRVLDANQPATADALAQAEANLGFELPLHYRSFLMQANGCEGMLAGGYVALWSAFDLAPRNEGYCVNEFAPGLLLIGSDGGDTAYALDLRKKWAPVVALPFIPMEYELIEFLGANVGDLLKSIQGG